MSRRAVKRSDQVWEQRSWIIEIHYYPGTEELSPDDHQALLLPLKQAVGTSLIL